jgi:ubiquinone/menaquinone biosynthesis C-methylase UbiE
MERIRVPAAGGATRASTVRRRSRWLLATGLALLVRIPALGAEPTDHTGPAGATPGLPTGQGTAQGSASAHDSSHPPIDCPLRKAGIDPTHMRPFEDAEKYIAFLERADRAAWQKPDAVVNALGLSGGETVVDLGAGSGYFTFRLAKVLPRGKVIAADTEAEMIRHIHHKATTEGISNVQPVLIQPADPRIPAEADVVFVCDVLHHVADRAAWLDKLVGEMKVGARLVLIEFKEGPLPEGPPESAKITRAQILDLLTKAGLTLVSERADLLPYQTFLIFRKPS